MDLRNTLLVDNTASNFANQLGNGVPIVPFYGKDEEDVELVKLGAYLKALAKKDENLKEVNEQYFQFWRMKGAENQEEAAKMMFGSSLKFY